MTTPSRSHYLLFSAASAESALSSGGTWRFSLECVGGGHCLSANDFEESCDCVERLELLAVVRGLEALDESAHVTLVTKSRYVSRGLRLGLTEWRANGWQWERFGQVVPIRDCDLWKRIDRALAFHEVDCRLWRFGVDARPARNTAGSRLAAAARSKIRRVSQAAATWGQSLQGAGLAAG